MIGQEVGDFEWKTTPTATDRMLEINTKGRFFGSKGREL